MAQRAQWLMLGVALIPMLAASQAGRAQGDPCWNMFGEQYFALVREGYSDGMRPLDATGCSVFRERFRNVLSQCSLDRLAAMAQNMATHTQSNQQYRMCQGMFPQNWHTACGGQFITDQQNSRRAIIFSTMVIWRDQCTASRGR